MLIELVALVPLPRVDSVAEARASVCFFPGAGVLDQGRRSDRRRKLLKGCDPRLEVGGRRPLGRGRKEEIWAAGSARPAGARVPPALAPVGLSLPLQFVDTGPGPAEASELCVCERACGRVANGPPQPFHEGAEK